MLLAQSGRAMQASMNSAISHPSTLKNYINQESASLATSANKESTAHETCRAAGTMVAGGNKNTCHWQPLALYQFDMCTFEKVWGIIKIWAPWPEHFVLWQIQSWYLQQLKQIELISTWTSWRQWSCWKISTLSYDYSYRRNIWFFDIKNHYYLPSDFNEILHYKHQKKSLFVPAQKCFIKCFSNKRM